MLPIAGSSKDPEPSTHDYTEGASAQDIGEVIDKNLQVRTRQGSEYSTYYDEEGEGAMFSGPGHSANPSSVSRMSHIELGRRSSDLRNKSRRKSMDSRTSRMRRRDSRDSQVSRQTVEGAEGEEGADETDLLLDDDAESSRRGRQKSLSPQRKSMFENLANIFGRQSTDAPRDRRRSISARSSTSRLSRRSSLSEHALDTDVDEEERWGYSSGEEDSDVESMRSQDIAPDAASITASMNYDSEPPSPVQANQTLPLLGFDSVFDGEARIDMDTTFTLLDPPPPGPPSRQTVYIADEDTTIRFIGYETIFWRVWAWRLSCVLTLGIVGLLGHWFPYLWLRWVAREKAFIDSRNGFLVVESSYRAIMLLPIQTIKYQYPITSVFPEKIPTIPGTPAFQPSNEALGIHDDLLENLLVIDYRYNRFAVDPRTGIFTMVRDWRDRTWSSVSATQTGIDENTRRQRLTLFSKNEIDIEGKTTIGLLVDEIIHPFYVFQIASVILWTLDDYYYYAFCIALISILSIGTTLIETKKTIARMREMSKLFCQMDVLREGAFRSCDSTELIPGDIVNLSTSNYNTIPADIFLLSGDAIVNESMLTGESVPVSKVPVKDEDFLRWRDDKAENAKTFLYCGTKAVRIRGSYSLEGQGRPALGLVARTGFTTTKGALIRSMLFPKPIGFKFYRDSVRFIGVLAGIALLGFSYSAIEFIKMGLPWQTILIRALDLITVVVPPALPATLSIGTSFSIGRLRKLGIFCISPSRVNVAGKINVCCFDKTGTLTEDGLDILGVRSLERNVHRFGELLEDVHDLPLGKDKATFLHALATCHSLKMVDGETIGDPLDIKMFGFTKWTLEEGRVAGTGNIKAKGAVVEQTALVQTVVRPPGSAQFRLEDALKGASKHAHFLELGVIRTFEFVSALRRMSVIVKRLKSSSMEIYVKGAPEVMVDICDKSTFPEDYDDLLSYYTKRGYRVIAIAGKTIENLSWLKAQRMKREQAESGLKFLGLVIFENRLKPGTAPAIQALRSAHLACRMITGDNPLTAVSVARECGLINQAAHVFTPAFIRGNSGIATSKLEWSSMDDPDWKLDSYSLKPVAPPHHTIEGDINFVDYALVVTGDVFRWMLNHAPLETLQRMLVKAQVFARMSPDEKNEVVERLQTLGYTVLMCGDGANDCAALKAADVGISLSEAEASVAAPFTTSTPDIGCVLEVIKEGRCALVTSFSCFKYMALYSMIQFTSVTFLYSFASSLGDFQFLYIDLFIIIPIAVTMGRTLPYPRIYPKRPTASLVSKKVLASIIGQILITSAVQGWAFFWVRRQEWYTPPPAQMLLENNKLESLNFENSSLFLISCFQYILVAAVFSIGPPYRKSMWTNGWLMTSICALTAFNVLVLLAPPIVLQNLLDLMTFPMGGRYTLLMVAGINVAISLAFEQWGTQVVSRVLASGIKWWQSGRRRSEGKAAYKVVEGGMRI
ncbi:P-type ATPase [Crepidotus variabilis]|uniref:Cation-transporting ATPase n=1 Tax=Crepidotus variabilis TaxID=179855 RepID=A0A9P6EHY2_9AGAR|nr:P-type ATPase [Crepidotus variabilis]